VSVLTAADWRANNWSSKSCLLQTELTIGKLTEKSLLFSVT